MLDVRVETLGEVADRQPVLTKNLHDLILDHGPEARAEVHRLVTGFGTYLRGVYVLEGDQ